MLANLTKPDWFYHFRWSYSRVYSQSDLEKIACIENCAQCVSHSQSRSNCVKCLFPDNPQFWKCFGISSERVNQSVSHRIKTIHLLFAQWALICVNKRGKRPMTMQNTTFHLWSVYYEHLDRYFIMTTIHGRYFCFTDKKIKALRDK